MGEMRFTQHQQEAVEVLGGNLLVSAAAGSGKTAVLTERVIRLLTGEQPVSADRIIVVTFTVAAADEMRRRISGRLAELMEEKPGDSHLQSQLMLLPKARISTIHKLCNELIKENQQALGLSGDQRIAEEAELSVLKQEVLGETLEAAYAAGDPAFTSLVEFTCTRNDRPLTDLILTVYDFIRSFAFPLDFLEQALAMYREEGGLDDSPWARPTARHTAAALEECIRLTEGSLELMRQDPEVEDKYGEAFRSDLQQFRALWELAAAGRLAEAAELGFHKQSLKAIRKYGDPDFLELLKGRRQKAQDIAAGLFKRFLAFTDGDFREDRALLLPRTETLFALVRDFYQSLEEKKQALGVLDYADLEHYALRLLAERREGNICRTAAAEALSQRYEQIMIDECQDINQVQELIFNLLSRQGANLFMVGDVKQSIYRFRKAMPGLFIQKKDRFAPYDPETHSLQSEEVITLEHNFRSRGEVCALVNCVFSQIMSREMGEIDYGAGEALVPGAVFPAYPEACPEVHILDYSREGEEEKTQAEARYTARLIRRMKAEGYQVEAQGSLRPCAYGDFAILLRSCAGKAPVYAAALKEAGIPCFSDSTEGYFEAYEVAVMLNLLRVLDNPLLDVPLASVLLSPLGGFSPDKLGEIRLARREGPFYLALRALAEAGDSQCGAFLELLSRLRQKAAVLPADSLIQEIYDQTDFVALARALDSGEQKDANLRLLLAHAEGYERAGAGGLSGFLRYLDRVIESGQDFTCANTGAAGGAVRILSIHASKGLQFPICIVADCGKRFNKSDLNSRCQLNPTLGFSMKITDSQTLRSYASFPFEAVRLQTEKETISEEMRVLYVAMTRAKEKLILTMTLPDAEARLRAMGDSLGEKGPSPYQVFSAPGFDGWLLPALLRHPDMAPVREQAGCRALAPMEAPFRLRACLARTGAGEDAEQPGRADAWAEPDPALCQALREAIGFQYPRQPLTRVPAKLTVTQIAKQSQGERIQLEARPAFLQRQGLTPAQRGTILHSFMQFADFEAAERDLPGETARLVEKGFLTQEEAAALSLGKIEAFLRSPLYARMKGAEELLREYKFLYFLKAGEVDPELEGAFAQEEILIQGIADCLLFEPEGITIVDYKTDYAPAETLMERYHDQLRIYKDAISQAFSRPVRQCLLYALQLERSIEILC